MQRSLMFMTFVLFITASTLLYAQTTERFTDLRGRSYRTEDLAAVLFPETAPRLRLRGIGPRQVQAPSVEKIAVALNVNFAFDSDTILPQYYSDLNMLGEVLTQHTQETLEIGGHTDITGTQQYNQALSQRRAESVKRYLVQHYAIGAERLRTKGYGASQPRTTNATSTGRRINRRVEVVRDGLL